MDFKTIMQPVSEDSIAQAAQWLTQGQVVGMPTETVYGLAASALDSNAVKRIFAAKGRPQDNPLIVHIDSMDMLPEVVSDIPDDAVKLAKVFWPGPLTMVLPRGEALADEVCAGLSTVGVRMPAHPAARALIHESGLPLAAPSANLSGSPSPTTAAHVLADMDGRIPFILDGGSSLVGVESTVLSLENDTPEVLRPGFVTAEEIADVLGKTVRIAHAVTEPLAEGEQPHSPGMKYKHYAPKANVTLVKGNHTQFVQFLDKAKEKGVYALCFTGELGELPVEGVSYGDEHDSASQAAGLFAALRKLDDIGAETVYARLPEDDGVGFAVYNRLLRAAAFRVIDA